MPWKIEKVKLKVTKHFALKYMNNWYWDFHDLRDAIRDAYRIEKIGKDKFEIYIQKSGLKKIITVYRSLDDELICISGAEGGKRI